MNDAGWATRSFRRVEHKIARPLRVLTYHRIAESSSEPRGLRVSPGNFDAHLASLATAGVVPLDRTLSLEAGKRPRGYVHRFAITFDDGYADNLEVALPLLERHDVPATVFVATFYIDRPYFWWDRLFDIVVGGNLDTTRVVDAAYQVGLLVEQSAETLAPASSASVHDTLFQALIDRHAADKVGLLDELGRALSFIAPIDAARPLTTEKLQELAAHPLITIGAHTHTHPQLTAVSPEEASRDVAVGARLLDELLGPTKRLFAYPHGKANKVVARLVKSAGHDFAFTTVSRPISMTDSSLLLPRISVTDIDGGEFARRRGLNGE